MNESLYRENTHIFKSKSKVISAITLLSFLAISSTGCMRVYDDIRFNEDGTITETQKQCISKEYIDSMNQSYNNSSNDSSNTSSSTEEMKLEILEDGQEYYVESDEKTVSASEISNNPLVTISKDIFYYGISSDSDETITTGYSLEDAIEQSIYMKLSIHLLGDIIETNANVKNETIGNTAVFDTSFTESSWYAYTSYGKELINNDITPPVIKVNKKSKYTNSAPTVDFSDNVGLASILVNGKAYSQKNFKQGKNTITAIDIKGNKSSAQFYYDTKKPVVKGLKTGKTYKKKAVFYVKDKIAISKVTVNSKKKKLSKKNLVKKGKYKNYYKFTISKAGSYTVTVTDKAGNSSYYYFYIR